MPGVCISARPSYAATCELLPSASRVALSCGTPVFFNLPDSWTKRQTVALETRCFSHNGSPFVCFCTMLVQFKFLARVISIGQERLCRLQPKPDSLRNVSLRRAQLKRLDSAGEVVQAFPPDAHRKERPPFYHSPVRHKQT